MQISDKLGQYNRNVTNGTEELRSAQGVQKMVSTVGDLANGSIFEGTISQIKNGKVVLALGNGQLISARLDGKIDLQTGSSMFFQVKSNDGVTISIRPYAEGSTGNPILLNALTAAQVPVTQRNLTMVDTMMQEQMPIGKQSVLDMVKLLNSAPEANVETIVKMAKLGLPVTEEMAAQFEHYMSDRYMILDEMELATNGLVAALGDESLEPGEAFLLYSKLVNTILGNEGAGESQNPGQSSQSGQATVEGQLPQQPATTLEGQSQQSATSLEGQPQQPATILESQPQQPTATLEGQSQQPASVLEGQPPQQQEVLMPNNQETGNPELTGTPNKPVLMPEMGNTLGQLLGEEQLANLTKVLQNIPTLTGNADIFQNAVPEDFFVDTMTEEDVAKQGLLIEPEAQQEVLNAGVNKELTAGEFLKTLQNAIAENSEYGYAGLSKLFHSTEFKAIFKHAVFAQWLMEPGQLKEENKISTLYEKMERQMAQMESAVRMAGGTQSSFLQAAADVRGNIEFMNQMNQIYTYVQLPLKLSGQNANGELYVYTNKKQLKDPDAELTAFLHLDMEHLGSTDVSVKMKDRKVKTNFYLPDDASYDLVEKHLPILEKRLKNKGYSCTITIQREKKETDFVENFLQKEQPPAGSLHRYSFDVRA